MSADTTQQLQQLPQVKAEPAASQQQHKPRWRERHLAKKQQQQQQQIRVKQEASDEPPPPQQQQHMQQSSGCSQPPPPQQQQPRQRVSHALAVHNAALARRQLQLALQRDAFMARFGDIIE
jgi:hypothetical protein